MADITYRSIIYCNSDDIRRHHVTIFINQLFEGNRVASFSNLEEKNEPDVFISIVMHVNNLDLFLILKI